MASIHSVQYMHSAYGNAIACVYQHDQILTGIEQASEKNCHEDCTLRGLATASCNQIGQDSDMARSTYPSFCSAGHLHRCQLHTGAQVSVCKESGEAVVANMEAAGLNRNMLAGPWSGPTTA